MIKSAKLKGLEEDGRLYYPEDISSALEESLERLEKKMIYADTLGGFRKVILWKDVIKEFEVEEKCLEK